MERRRTCSRASPSAKNRRTASATAGPMASARTRAAPPSSRSSTKAPQFELSFGIVHFEVFERAFGTPVPVGDERVALVLQIGDAHLRRPEAAGRQVAEAAEEGDRMSERRWSGCRKRNHVEQPLP